MVVTSFWEQTPLNRQGVHPCPFHFMKIKLVPTPNEKEMDDKTAYCSCSPNPKPMLNRITPQ